MRCFAIRKKFGKQTQLVAPVRVYLDDLEEAARLLSQDGEGEVWVRADAYELDGVEDIANIPERRVPLDLTLSAREPQV